MEFFAECFWTGVTEDDLDRLDARVHAVVRAAPGVGYGGSMLVPEDEVVFCFFDGESVEAVRTAAERAEIPFVRIVESAHFAPMRSAQP